MMCFMLIGAICGILFLKYLEHTEAEGGTPVTGILSIIGFLVCMYGSLLIQIIVHEAGHLLFGLLTGYRFNSFRIYHFMWIKENDRISFRKMTVAGTGGQCLMGPPDLVDGSMPVLLYNFGGAIVNVVVGVISVALSFLFLTYSFGWMLLVINALISFIYALMNGLPIRMGTVNNDGRNALDMAGNKEAIRAFWIQMRLNEQISKGIRLKDMPEEWFEIPSDESMKNAIIATVGVLACNRLIDEHRFEEADERMKRLLALDCGIVGLYRHLLMCDRMYVELITENRRDVLDKMRTKDQIKLMKAMKNYPSVLRTEYAYALLYEKDRKKAESMLEKFEICAKRFPYPSEIEAERELIEIAAAAN